MRQLPAFFRPRDYTIFDLAPKTCKRVKKV